MDEGDGRFIRRPAEVGVSESSMEHTSNSNAFNVLFIVSFFACLAMVLIQHG
jgi:hypothetical protein